MLQPLATSPLTATTLLLALLAVAGLNLGSVRALPEPRLVQSTGRNGVGPNQSAPLYEAPDSSAEEGPASCGYASCPRFERNKLNVHVIAHTHDDVGWLKTVDQYFYGTKKQFNKVGVEYILDSLIPALMMDKSKRFVYVEMSFFTKWWREQEERTKSIVRQLVNEGRLEFINGGWCMNDEATVSYHSTIEQMTLGLRFLNETFGACAHPKVGWQIDPFGHSSEQASLFAQFGFDGMFFSRIGYRDKFERTRSKSLDLIWHGDRALPGQSGSIFTNVFRDAYELDLFCFDVQCNSDAVVDNKNSYEYNVDRMGQQLIEYARNYATSKLTNNILVPFGGDFHFSAAGQNFKSFDRLIKFVRANAKDINIFYSTPSCYQLAVHEAIQAAGRNLSLPEKYDDFMPYDSSATVWWSGYFSSRPSTKLIERETAQLLQTVRMIALANLFQRLRTRQIGSSDWLAAVEAHERKCLQPLWEILGDLQHHDAVTGTEKQHVTDDYQRRVADASRLCARMITPIKRQQIDERLSESPEFERLKAAATKVQLDPIYLEETMFCQALNISQCEALESDVDLHRYGHLKLIKAHLLAHQHHQQQQHQQQNHSSSSLSHSMPVKPIPLPRELETKAILLTIYNPLARPVSQADIRLPCNGNCDLDKLQVVHLATNQSLRLTRLPLPAGVAKLSYRESRTSHEFLFYADVPALGSSTYVIGDDNTDALVDEELSDDAVVITDESLRQNKQNIVRGRRIQRRKRTLPSKDELELIASDDADYCAHRDDDDDDDDYCYRYFSMALEQEDGSGDGSDGAPVGGRRRRDAGSLSSQQSSADRVVIKFDMRTGVITGLRRASDGSALNITQKFGQYFPADMAKPPGAYIFRPNSSEPHLFEKPVSFKMYKRFGGSLIEIHQKWADWIWQTIRVDAKKNYIEFDYVVGPIPIRHGFVGREVVTRYITNMANEGVFLTDSNARQLLPRRRLNDSQPAQTGGSFYPVVSTLMIRNNQVERPDASAEAVAVLVDRPQAGTSLNNGDLELLIHRRLLEDDHFGVDEALNEPGEDGRGLVTRGKHRLFLKFKDIQPSAASELPAPTSGASNQRRLRRATRASKPKGAVASQPSLLVQLPSTPRQNLTYERLYSRRNRDFNVDNQSPPVNMQFEPLRPTYLAYDKLYNDIRQESIKYALKPLLTFDRLRVSVGEFLKMFHASNSSLKADQSLLNEPLPDNVHLLTLQPWKMEANQLLMRFENLDNPLTIHPMPDVTVYESLLRSYGESASLRTSKQTQQEDPCNTRSVRPAQVEVEHLLKGIRITSLTELNLGANAKLSEDKRLDWTEESCEVEPVASSTSFTLSPRQIRTFVVTFELAGGALD